VTRPDPSLILHPVRLRIVQAVAARPLTTAEVAASLPDVPQATLYRHMAKLADGGLLEVAAERRVRGATERTYRLATLKAAPLATGGSVDDRLEAFTRFAASLIGEFARYLHTPGADPEADGAGFRQVTLWLTDDEFQSFAEGFAHVLAPAMTHEPREDRSPVTLTTVLIPGELP
jgi:DNA-binding transcriptional ArsR family regulator